MTYEVNKLPAKIVIGKAGENLYTEVSIDIKPWAKEYPSATYAIVYMRSDGSTYPVAVANQGNVVTWLPTATDLISGYGKLEVRMYDGEVIAKSVVIATYVSPSLEVGEFPDDKAPDWVQEIIDAYKGKGSLVAKADLDGDSIYYGADGKVHSKGGGGGTVDAYTKAETDALLEGKADQGEIEEVTAEISEIKQSLTDDYKVKSVDGATIVNNNGVIMVSDSYLMTQSMDLGEFIKGKYIHWGNGIVLNLSNLQASEYIKIPPNTTLLKVYNTFHYGSDGLAFYDNNKKYISGYGDNTQVKKWVMIDVPQNASFFRLSSFITDNPIVLYSVVNDVDKLKEDVTKLQNASISGEDVIIDQNYIFDINHLSLNSAATLIDGVYTFTAKSSGNSWSDYTILDTDLKSGIGNIIINVTDITNSGVWTVYKIYRKKDGTQKFDYVANIKTSGLYTYNLDLNYMAVYNDYDGEGVNFVVANTSHSTEEVVYSISIDRYDLVETVSDYDNLPRTLNAVLNEVKDDIDTLKSGSNSDEIELASYDGSKYLIQIKPDGTLTYIPKLPSNILYIGNSLLVGFGNHGMASTTVDDDYFSKINAYLTEQGVSVTANKLEGTTFEGATNDTTVQTYFTDKLLSRMSENVQLVIVQLGDNVNTTEKIAEFAKSCGMMLSYIRQHCPNARVVWVGMWYSSSEKLSIIRNACNKYGCKFIDIHDLSSVSGNRNAIGNKYIDGNGVEQTITTDGVASHPSDQGFTQIANRVIKQLFI